MHSPANRVIELSAVKARVGMPLPWPVAVLVILGICSACWLAIFEVARQIL